MMRRQSDLHLALERRGRAAKPLVIERILSIAPAPSALSMRVGWVESEAEDGGQKPHSDGGGSRPRRRINR